VLFSEPRSTETPRLPFHFVSGLALSSRTIGLILACQAVAQIVVQMFLFPPIDRAIGHHKTFCLVAMLYPLLYLAAPYIALLPLVAAAPMIFLLLAGKAVGQALSYPSIFMLLVDHSPSPRSLGKLNGAAGSAAALCRAVGPFVAGMAHLIGRVTGFSGMAWWAMACVALVALAESLALRAPPTSTDEETAPVSRDGGGGDGQDEEGEGDEASGPLLPEG